VGLYPLPLQERPRRGPGGRTEAVVVVLVAQVDREVAARWEKSARSRSAPTRWPKN
jgi:hypothetical protein